jgi:hypothetical protein
MAGAKLRLQHDQFQDCRVCTAAAAQRDGCTPASIAGDPTAVAVHFSTLFAATEPISNMPAAVHMQQFHMAKLHTQPSSYRQQVRVALHARAHIARGRLLACAACTHAIQNTAPQDCTHAADTHAMQFNTPSSEAEASRPWALPVRLRTIECGTLSSTLLVTCTATTCSCASWSTILTPQPAPAPHVARLRPASGCSLLSAVACCTEVTVQAQRVWTAGQQSRGSSLAPPAEAWYAMLSTVIKSVGVQSGLVLYRCTCVMFVQGFPNHGWWFFAVGCKLA